jgi:hypothetical protein
MSPPTVAAFAERAYLPEVARRDRAGRDAREALIRRHILPAIGERLLREILYRDLQALARERLAARIPLRTVRAIAAELRALFCYAREKRCYAGPVPLLENFLPTVRGLIRLYAAELERLGLDAARTGVLRRYVPAGMKRMAVAEISPADLKALVMTRAAAGLPARELRSFGRALFGLFSYGRESHCYHDTIPTAFLLASPVPGALPGAVVNGAVVNAARAREASRAVGR